MPRKTKSKQAAKKKATRKSSKESSFSPAEKRRAKRIYDKLLELYPDARCAL